MRCITIAIVLFAVTQADAAIHNIKARLCERRRCSQAHGSAVSFAYRDGRTYFLTCAHVVQDADQVWVGFESEWVLVTNICLYTDSAADLAVFSLPKKMTRFPISRIGGEATRRLTVRGYDGRTNRIGGGTGHLDRHKDKSPFWSYVEGVRATEGQSGGAVLNEHGELVGIVRATADTVASTQFINSAGIIAALSACELSHLVDSGKARKVNMPKVPELKIRPMPDPIGATACQCATIAERIDKLTLQMQALTSRLNEIESAGNGELNRIDKSLRLIEASITNSRKELAEMKRNFLTVQIRDGDKTATKTYKHGDTVKLKVTDAK